MGKSKDDNKHKRSCPSSSTDEAKTKRRKIKEADEKHKSKKKHKSRHSRRDEKSGGKRKDKSRKYDSKIKFQELSNDDYFSKNNEFAMWLKEEKKVFFSDLSSVAETFTETHSRRLDSKGERQWSDGRSKTIHGAYVQAFESPSEEVGSNDPPAPLQLQLERWEMEGSKKKGRVNGLAGLATRLHSESTSSGPTQRERELETELESLRQLMSQVNEKMARYDALERKVSELQQLKTKVAAFEEMSVQMRAKMEAFERTQAQMNEFMRMAQQHEGQSSSFRPLSANLPFPSIVAPMPYLQRPRQPPQGTVTISTPFGLPHSPHNVDDSSDSDDT